MSIEHTAEDFAKATLATRGAYEVARRMSPEDRMQWCVYSDVGLLGWQSDEVMAASGWVPVVEATEVMQHRQIDAEAHLDQIERLSKRASAAEDQIESQRLVIEELREENDRLERIPQAPLSMRDLEVAWEAAEEAEECREGDVLVVRDALDAFTVWAAPGRHLIDADTRVLSRAPQREPWQDLADAINEAGAQIQENIVRALHKRGVRVTGGEES